MTRTDLRIAEVLEYMRRAPLIERDWNDKGLREALLGAAPALRLVRKDEREGK